MLALDLFCGAGGAGLGLEEAGFTVVGYDAWQPAINTHRANKRVAIRADLKTRTMERWQGKVVLVWGSPPCQPFSQAGQMRGRDDERNCVPDFIDRLGEVLPPVFVMENVKGLVSKKFAGYFAMVRARMRLLGYRVEWRVLNSADYGVPQTRQRVFVVGVREGCGVRFQWPEPTHAKKGDDLAGWVSMARALGWGMTEKPAVSLTAGSSRQGGPAPMDGGSGARAALKRERDAGRWEVGDSFSTPKDDYEGRSASRWKSADNPSPSIDTKVRDWNLRLVEVQAHRATGSLHEPAPTLTSSMDNGNFQWTARRPSTAVMGDERISPPGYRGGRRDYQQNPEYDTRSGTNAIKVTPAEAACLQDFPPGYVFTGNKTTVFTQIGNAVPRTMARVLASSFTFNVEAEGAA